MYSVGGPQGQMCWITITNPKSYMYITSRNQHHVITDIQTVSSHK